MVALAKTESKKITRKPLTLLERKQLPNGAVFCRVQNGGGYKYDIWLHENGRATCQQAENGEPCPSTRGGHRCYHVQYAVDLELLRERETKVTAVSPQPLCPGCQKAYSAGRCRPGHCFWNSWYRF